MLLEDLTSLNSLLSETQINQLKQLTHELSPVQTAWLAGYLTSQANIGVASTNPLVVAAPSAVNLQAEKLTILYGSQTGNGRGIAESLAEKVKAAGYQVNLCSMGDYNQRQLKQETMMALVVSTHGEGEAPDDAIELHGFLASKRAPKLANLRYCVLALGDSSYEHFCQTGKDFDARLAALGAKGIISRVDCDVDYEADANTWLNNAFNAFEPILKEPADPQPHSSVVPFVQSQLQTQGFSKQNPFEAEILTSQKITGRDSIKNIFHMEIDLTDANLKYQPGDALGVWFSNSAELVNEILNGLNLDANAEVSINNQTVSCFDALIDKKEITQLSPNVIKLWAEKSKNEQLTAIAEDKTQLRQYMLNHQLADLVKNHSIDISPQELIDSLRGQTPRLYSIASSQDEVEDEVHLTVALVKEQRDEVVRYGGASQYLTQAAEGQKVKVYIEPNKHFKLPENNDAPVIMIGPGTGIAPFRAFLQQRQANGIKGNTWLFFGNPHFEQDFLYQTELQQYLKSAVLERLDTAFSRDQAHKIYVQHRILEQGELLWQWLEKGAHLYICGDADKMAKDVQQALIEVISRYGNKNKQQAQEYLETLRAEKRYQKDVY